MTGILLVIRKSGNVILQRAISDHSSQGNRKLKIEYRQYNGQMKQYKRTNNDLPNNTQKTEDRATRTPLKDVVNPGVPER